MVDGINFNGKTGKIGGIKANNNIKAENKTRIGLFGFGNGSGKGVGFERHVVPQDLAAKFDSVSVPKYTKGIPQLEISDSDYIPDKVFEDENSYCEC